VGSEPRMRFCLGL